LGLATELKFIIVTETNRKGDYKALLQKYFCYGHSLWSGFCSALCKCSSNIILITILYSILCSEVLASSWTQVV